jgi:hypothetical protein
MIDGNANTFIDKMYYEDHYVMFNKEKYFCQRMSDQNRC